MRAALKDIESEVIVVDNASTDGSREFFAGRFPEVQFIFNTENAGFAKANNQALKISHGKYILFLNPDTLLPEDVFTKCMAFIAAHGDAIAAGVRMIDGSGKFLKESKRAFPDPATSLYKLTGLSALFPRSKTLARYHLGHLDEHKNHEVDVLAGAFMMVPRKVLDKVGGFDEDYFMYGEDIDLSYRIQKAGFANYYFAETAIIHFKGESTKKGSLNYVKLFYRAMSVFVKKHYGSSRASVYNVLLQTGIFIRGAMSAISRFLRWIGMPVIDLLTVFFAFWVVRELWIAYLLPYLAYDSRILLITYPAFAALFLITAYYAGLYDNGYIQSRLNKSLLISTLVLFTIYALVPESIQFSRGLLLTSVLLAWLLMTGMRMLLSSLNIISNGTRSPEHRIAIAGTTKELSDALQLLSFSGLQDNVLGRVAVAPEKGPTLSAWKDLPRLLHSRVIQELIYCQGTLGFKDIIQSVEQLPPDVGAGFFAAGSSSIIGSSDKKMSGEYRAQNEYYRLNNPLYCRVKRLFDASAALAMILTFPVHLLIKKRPFALIENCFHILLARQSFVGYATTGEGLPPLKPALITSTGLPAARNSFPAEALTKADILYAKNYSVFTDMLLVYRGYQDLS